VAVHLYAFPHFSALRSANELPRILLTQEIVDRHTFRIDARLGELGSRFDVATTPDGRHFSNKAPGLSFLAVPAYAALRVFGRPAPRLATWVLRVFAVTLPALLFLLGFWRLARRFAPQGGGGDDAPRRAALLAYALGSMALPYGILFFSHQLAAAAAGGAFVAAVALVRGAARRPDLLALATGALAGLAVLADYQAALAAAAVGVYLLWRSRRRLRDALLALLGAAPFAALLALYHRACFGSPFRTGYSFAADPAHQQGVLGVVGPNRAAFWHALLAPDNGLLVLSPWVLLAVAGGVAIARDRAARARVGAEASVCAVVAALYLLFLGSLVPEFGRAGWSVGPRYIAVALPFLAWLAAAGLAAIGDRVAPLAAAYAAILVGVVVHVAAATTFPHWPTAFRNPLYEVSFRALGEGLAPHSLGTAVGLRGLASLAPIYALVAALCGVLLAGRSRRRWLATGAALVIAVAIVLAYSRFPGTGPAGERPWSHVRAVWEPR